MTEEIGDEEWKLSFLFLSWIHLDLGATRNTPSWWLFGALPERSRRYQLLWYVLGTRLGRDRGMAQPRYVSRTALDLWLKPGLRPSRAALCRACCSCASRLY